MSQIGRSTFISDIQEVEHLAEPDGLGETRHRPSDAELKLRSFHDDVNGFRIVNCRSTTWPSCISSE
jgi:hypothetical protein